MAAWWKSRDLRRGRPTEAARTAALEAAVAALVDGNEAGAEAALTRWVESDSSDPSAYRILGSLYRRRGEIGRAIRLHQNGLLRDDLPQAEREAALSELAADFESGGFFPRAIAAHEDLLAGRRRRRESLAALVRLCPGQGGWERAREAHRQLEKLDGQRDPEGLAALLVGEARGLLEDGEDSHARALLKTALRKAPADAEAGLLLAGLESEAGRTRSAQKRWRKVAFAGGPLCETAWTELAASFGSRTQAFERLVRLRLEAEPADAAARRQLANVLVGRGELDAALAELRRILDRSPRDWRTRVEIGRLLIAKDRDEEALKEFGELLSAMECARPTAPGGGQA